MRHYLAHIKHIAATSVVAGLLYSGGAVAALWPDHIDQAQTYVSTIKADNNDYGTPSTLYYDNAAKLHALTQCSTFATLLLKNTFPTELTDTVLIALTGSNSPYADQWYSALQQQNADATSGLSLKKRDKVTDIQHGDILASAYTVAGNTGHVMLVDTVTLSNTDIEPPYPVPNVTKVNRYIVKIYDSTNSIHGNYANASNVNYRDSRYNKQWNGTAWVADTGIGSGYIAIYEEVATGNLVAWAWNTSLTTDSFYYNVTPPAGSTKTYRPIVAGFISGL